MSHRTPALLVVLLLSAGAANAATLDPCAKPDDLTTRDQILAAVPADDRAWADALARRGIAKTDDGWMQYFNGGSATASNRAFVAAFGDYCAAKARAAAAPKTASRAPVAAVPITPPAEVVARTAEAKDKNQKIRKTFFGTRETAAPDEPPSAPVDCTGLCDSVQSCKDAGMDGGTTSLEFRCRKAAADARAAKCSCG